MKFTSPLSVDHCECDRHSHKKNQSLNSLTSPISANPPAVQSSNDSLMSLQGGGVVVVLVVAAANVMVMVVVGVGRLVSGGLSWSGVIFVLFKALESFSRASFSSCCLYARG